MEQKPINPWSWSAALGFDQAQLIDGREPAPQPLVLLEATATE